MVTMRDHKSNRPEQHAASDMPSGLLAEVRLLMTTWPLWSSWFWYWSKYSTRTVRPLREYAWGP